MPRKKEPTRKPAACWTITCAHCLSSCITLSTVISPSGPVPAPPGGLGAGVLAFLNGTLRPGIDTVLDLVGFDRLLEGADLVVTGEGRIDGQTLSGKVISGVALRAQKKGVPVIAIAGDLADGAEKLYDRGVTALFSINRLAVEFEVCRPYSEQNLYLTMRNLMRFSSLFGER